MSIVAAFDKINDVVDVLDFVLHGDDLRKRLLGNDLWVESSDSDVKTVKKRKFKRLNWILRKTGRHQYMVFWEMSSNCPV